MKKFLFYFGHPAQYLFLKHAIKILKEDGHHCDIVVKSKDVLVDLLKADEVPFINIQTKERNSGTISAFFNLVKRDFRLAKLIKDTHYDLFMGTDPSLAHIGFLKGTPVITVLEDDIEIISKLAKLTYPFTTIILTPTECKTGKYNHKTIRYNGYMKLAYLHPNRFNKSHTELKKPYFLIRISKLNAYHDKNIGGLTDDLILELINYLLDKGDVYISSERKLSSPLTPYILNIKPQELHNVLANAFLLISDSQSMSVEAAMLGIPSLRFSDFAGRISILEVLEHKYKLTFGINSNSKDKLFERLHELLEMQELSEKYEILRSNMLKDKIDVTSFLAWFLESFPKSMDIMKLNPSYQNRFK